MCSFGNTHFVIGGSINGCPKLSNAIFVLREVSELSFECEEMTTHISDKLMCGVASIIDANSRLHVIGGMKGDKSKSASDWIYDLQLISEESVCVILRHWFRNSQILNLWPHVLEPIICQQVNAFWDGNFAFRK